MKKLKSKKTFSDFSPVGVAGINKALRQSALTFVPVEVTLIDRIQSFYQQALQNLKALCP